MLVKDSGILGKIETGLGCADRAVGDGDALGLCVECAVKQKQSTEEQRR